MDCKTHYFFFISSDNQPKSDLKFVEIFYAIASQNVFFKSFGFLLYFHIKINLICIRLKIFYNLVIAFIKCMGTFSAILIFIPKRRFRRRTRMHFVCFRKIIFMFFLRIIDYKIYSICIEFSSMKIKRESYRFLKQNFVKCSRIIF